MFRTCNTDIEKGSCRCRPGTALDAEAQLRGTSVYLVDRVIPMLPRRLCEELCSLVPGNSRLTFSVIWDLSLVRVPPRDTIGLQPAPPRLWPACSGNCS